MSLIRRTTKTTELYDTNVYDVYNKPQYIKQYGETLTNMPQKPLDVMRQHPNICPKYNSDDSENHVSIIEMTIKQAIIKCML